MSELKRILDLPRRKAADQELANRLVTPMNDRLRKDGGAMSLWPIQCLALYEIYKCNGGIININVGGGKALVSLLAAQVLKAERPLLVVPASLKEQTKSVISEAQHSFHFPYPQIESYAAFSQAKNHTLLSTIQPDLIVMDEAHRLANKKAARTKRFHRYIVSNNIPVVALSGTLINKSLRDLSHIAYWCLGDSTPLPTSYHELEHWANTVDERVRPGHRITRSKLLRVTKDPRQWVSDRMAETLGFVTSWETDNVGASLIIQDTAPHTMDEIVEEKLKDVAEKWVDPNGLYLESALDKWRYMSQLSLGFYYRWKEQPPEDWLDARREWNSHVNQTINYSRGKVDSPAQVPREGHQWATWNAIKDTYTPVSEVVWLDDSLVQRCARWALKNKGIVWSPYRAFGERIEDYGVWYCGAGESPPESGAVCLSMRAHGEGKNLQAWDKNLFPLFPTTGKIAEQVLARTHRPGQKSDEVNVYACRDTAVQRAALRNARRDAKYLYKITKIRQKINRAMFVLNDVVQTELDATASKLLNIAK